MFKNCIFPFITALVAVFPAIAEERPDTVSLGEVVVTGNRARTEIIPVQKLAGDDLKRLNSNSVADAMRYFSGVQIKDYGGVGGIKTVNVRSMGTNHMGVSYDGVQLGNAQNGQIDLGQFSLDNIESISLYNGQKSRLLQPAKDFGNAADVYIRTRTPQFSGSKRYNVRAQFRTGSSDLINPSAVVEYRLSEKVNASLSAEWVKSSGKYKFRYRKVTPSGQVAYDTTATRENGDINATRLELNLHGNTSRGFWRAKAYNYHSERGIPGAIVNNVWRRGERIWDNNCFLQAAMQQTVGAWSTLLNAKFSAYRTHYVNNDDKLLEVDNLYKQKELYFSWASLYDILPGWSASVSYDFQWNTLASDIHNFARPDRYTNLVAAATAYVHPRFKIQASALGTFINDHVKGREAPPDKHVFTPAIFASVKPLADVDLSVRAFYKKSFRMPTFNDLYYADMGNSMLSPERVAQYNLGLVYSLGGKGLLKALTVSADAYYNRVKDKIIAYPKGLQFRWTMLNLGLVDIRGLDAGMHLTLTPLRAFDVTLRGQYTFQRAIDITNPADSYYRHQIPYIPRHSATLGINLSWRGWEANYAWVYVGERYNQQENISYNYSRPWYTSDLSFSKDFSLGAVNMRGLIEVNNLFAQDYEVILNYPMPKRTYRFTITVII